MWPCSSSSILHDETANPERTSPPRFERTPRVLQRSPRCHSASNPSRPSLGGSLPVSSKKGEDVHISLHHFAAFAVAASWTIGVMAQQHRPLASARIDAASRAVGMATTEAAAETSLEQPANDPVADPKAVVTLGHARFTVLTPELIRMEWAADGKFEDHASFVFINRRLPVPKYSREVSGNGKLDHQDRCSHLDLYAGRATAASPPTTSSVSITVDGKPVVWHREPSIRRICKGTTRTLDGALGDKTKEPIGNGLRLALRLGRRRRLDTSALRLRRLPLRSRREQPLAVGHGAPRRRPPGLVLLRLRPRLQEGSRRLRPRGRPHSAAAALCLRRVVVALLGLQRPGDRRNHPRLPRERYTPRCLRHRHGLAHQSRTA